MVGLHDYIFVASARDSIESLPESGASNKLGASFETPSGRRLVVFSCSFVSSMILLFIFYHSIFLIYIFEVFFIR